MSRYLPIARRPILLLAVLAALLALLLAVASAPSAAHARVTSSRTQRASAPAAVVLLHQRVVHVTIKNLAFGPHKVIVSPGTKVIWTNQDGVQHTVTSDSGIWDSGPINHGSHFARAFRKPGTFAYHCTIHPFMHGTIEVKK